MTDPQFDTNSAATGESASEALSPEGLGLDAATDAATADVSEETTADRGAELEALVSERTADLQRLQAEYANYKKRVDRDRDLARQSGVESVLRDFMPVLDSIELARQHDDLSDGFTMVIGELEKVAAKNGLVAFGAVGDAFDPVRHEALMQVQLESPVEVVTVSQVMQQGYELKGRVIRPARVAVANP